MNNPIEPDSNLEQRVEQIEREMKRARFALDHIKLDTGAARESLDTIEHRLSEANKLLRGIIQTQPDYSEKLDILAREQQAIKQDITAIHDVFVRDFERVEHNTGEINATLSERFDLNERKLDEHGNLLKEQGQLLREILARLPERREE